MDSTRDLTEQVVQHIREACNEIVVGTDNCSSDPGKKEMSEKFLEIFKRNLSTAINEVYFREINEETEQPQGMSPNQEEIEYEKAVMDIVSKRHQGTKLCSEVLEKTLAINKKAVMAMEVSQKAVAIKSFERPPWNCKKEDIKLGTRETAWLIKESTKKVVELKDTADEILKAAVIFRDLDDSTINASIN